MDSTDMLRTARLARVRYEWGRARRALLGFGPVLLLVAGAVALSRHPTAAAALGIATFTTGAAMLWYGRGAKYAVLPGVAAGSLPLVLALCASHVGHACTGDRCMMLCVPACIAGGVGAGLAVAYAATRRRAGGAFWVLASGLALLTGATGCVCAGYSGMMGLAIGYGVGVVPVLLGRTLAWRSP